MENHALRDTIAKMAAEMTVFRKMIKGDVATPDSSKNTSPSLSTTIFSQADVIPHVKSEFDELDFTLPPPHSTVDPRDAAFSSPSGSPKVNPTAATPNLTQHPAEMLCDLQCQLGAKRLQWGTTSSSPSAELETLAFLSLFTTLSQVLLANMVLTAYSLVLSPTAAISHSLKTETARAERLFPLSLLSTLTPTNLASALAMTTLTTTTRWSRLQCQSTFQINSLHRLLASSPALARPLRDATGRALRLTSSSDATSTGGLPGDQGPDGSSVMEALTRTMWWWESQERKAEERLDSNIGRPCTRLDECMVGRWAAMLSKMS